jgi:activator of HSP90 ATPase
MQQVKWPQHTSVPEITIDEFNNFVIKAFFEAPESLRKEHYQNIKKILKNYGNKVKDDESMAYLELLEKIREFC